MVFLESTPIHSSYKNLSDQELAKLTVDMNFQHLRSSIVSSLSGVMNNPKQNINANITAGINSRAQLEKTMQERSAQIEKETQEKIRLGQATQAPSMNMTSTLNSPFFITTPTFIQTYKYPIVLGLFTTAVYYMIKK